MQPLRFQTIQTERIGEDRIKRPSDPVGDHERSIKIVNQIGRVEWPPIECNTQSITSERLEEIQKDAYWPEKKIEHENLLDVGKTWLAAFESRRTRQDLTSRQEQLLQLFRFFIGYFFRGYKRDCMLEREV